MPDDQSKSVDEIINELHQHDVRFIYLHFTDVLGAVKNVTIPLEQFPDCIKRGNWFDGSSVEGYARILESDMYLKPELSTLSILPWEEDGQPAAQVICSLLTPDGELFGGDPRTSLIRAVREANSLGYDFTVAPELEFILFSPREGNKMGMLSQDHAGYFDLSTGLELSLRKEMVWTLNQMSIGVETSHHELAVGQQEIDFTPESALRSADNLVTARYTLRAIARKHGLGATFMPKPVNGMEGSGMHIHQSLRKIKTGRNAFADETDDYGLSEVARHFLAGLLYHARSLCLVLNPLVNSYKRLVKGFEAPVYNTWARVNRSALIRVPRINPQRLDTTRLEIRNPDPSCNPYLAYTLLLKCGLHGIKEKLPLPPPVEENLFAFDNVELQRRQIEHLPETLGEALATFQEDEVIREALGDLIFSKLLETKRREWQEYCSYVTVWEIERYLGE
ncbi:MAG: type I glutamate--ammonia ligase [Dehalococcoidales bacterium]|nr:type I glutamate--ammonia ligase [Dehalococcoidales bacterium]